MRKVNNWENVKAATERVKLPVGGYIVNIMGAKVVEFDGKDGGKFEKLEISIDIAEGEFKDFYANDYRSQQSEDKYWKGVLGQYSPKDDGSENDEWTKSSLKALIGAIEDSNPGYHWDWDETKLKGKKVGCIFRNKEWEFNGTTGFTAKPFKFISVEKIKTGNYRLPKDKLLNNSTATADTSSASSYQDIPDDDLPF
jgi:hypothetical protein